MKKNGGQKSRETVSLRRKRENTVAKLFMCCQSDYATHVIIVVKVRAQEPLGAQNMP
jgi:hypothetical protein